MSPSRAGLRELKYKEKEMKKRLIALLAVMLIAIGMAGAVPLFQVGPVVGFHDSLKGTTGEDWTKIENYEFGAEFRMNLAMFQLSVPVTYTYTDWDTHSLDIDPTLGLTLSIFGLIDLTAGVGVTMDMDIVNGHWLFNGHESSRWSDPFENAHFLYRVAGTVNLGNVGISCSYLMPTKGSFRAMDWMPDIDNSKLQFALLFGF